MSYEITSILPAGIELKLTTERKEVAIVTAQALTDRYPDLTIRVLDATGAKLYEFHRQCLVWQHK